MIHGACLTALSPIVIAWSGLFTMIPRAVDGITVCRFDATVGVLVRAGMAAASR